MAGLELGDRGGVRVLLGVVVVVGVGLEVKGEVVSELLVQADVLEVGGDVVAVVLRVEVEQGSELLVRRKLMPAPV